MNLNLNLATDTGDHMNLHLRPTQALSTQFILPNASESQKASQQQIWRRRALRIGRFDLVLKHEPAMELLREPRIYPLPFAPASCVGLINRRGNLIPVFDWQNDFDVIEEELSHANVLVLGRENNAVAIVISEVLEQLSIQGEIDFTLANGQDLPASLSRAIDGIIQHQGKLYFQLDHEMVLKQITPN